MDTQTGSKSGSGGKAVIVTSVAAIALLVVALGYALLIVFVGQAAESSADTAGISSGLIGAALVAAVGLILGVIAIVLRGRTNASSPATR